MSSGTTASMNASSESYPSVASMPRVSSGLGPMWRGGGRGAGGGGARGGGAGGGLPLVVSRSDRAGEGVCWLGFLLSPPAWERLGVAGFFVRRLLYQLTPP